MRATRITALIAALASAVPAWPAVAQAFPAKPVRIIVAFPPGGGVDIVARTMGPRLTKIWRQPVVVENRPGASGVIGTEAAARAAPDGHTLFIGTLGNLTANQYLYPRMPVDPLRDLAPLTQVVAVHFVMVAHPSLPAKNVKELIALARARPGQINYASSGPGGAPHLGAELFKSMTRVDMVHVPYKGSGLSFIDLLAGQVSLTCDSQLQSLPYIKAGRLRALAVLGGKRSPLLPDVATVGETVPGYELTNWFGMTVPAATPRDLISRLHADISKVLQQADFKEKIAGMGAAVVGSTPDQFGAFMKTESAKWGKVIREANIKAE
jgi:tripartite-type tricarboxylate transporter receptor subunit TctC